MRSPLLVGLIVAAGCSNAPPAPVPDLGCPSIRPALCDGLCVDTTGDGRHCGACGKACKVGEVCANSACATSCPMGQSACGGSCITTASDPAHCGKCDRPCQPGEVCAMGACAVSCPTGQMNCAGACVNPKSDGANCGACGTTCPKGQVCGDGKCAVSCPPAQTDCGGDCVNLKADNANCGGCGMGCKPGEVCAMGACALTCPIGFEKCGGACVNLQSDGAHCGQCGMACAMEQMCSSGRCAGVCPGGTEACNGACVITRNDPANCGKCGNDCTAMGKNWTCSLGKCIVLCHAPLVECDGLCVDPRFDPDHCNGCGTKCAEVAHGARGCFGGACTVGACNMGFGDCNAMAKDGCESDLSRDARNCGGCGKACKATESCCGGGCIPVMQDDKHCGACGNPCKQGLTCCAGQCLDPKFSMVNTLNCARPLDAFAVAGGDFGKTGAVDQLVADLTGISTVPPDQNPPPAQSPFVWIAAHDSHQVHRVDTKTGLVAGTYSSRGQRPSRGAVALDGSFWIANRCDNAPNDPACSNVSQILPDGTPGCTVSKAADGQPLPFVRALAIDANRFIWAGTWNDHRLHKIDPGTCKVIADFNMTANLGGTVYTSYPYGLAVDRDGLLWNSNLGSGWGGTAAWMALDVKERDPAKNGWKYAVPISGRTSYGIVIDRMNNVFLGQWGPCAGGVWRIDAMTRAVTQHNGGNGNCTRGVTIDTAGDVYAAEWVNPGCVAKFKGGTGQYLGRYCFPGLTYGVGIAGDTFGKIWLTGYQSNNVVRFNPAGVIDPGFPKPLPGQLYYNYSDWNGMILKTVTSNNAQAGTWTRTFDGGSNFTQWATATWKATTPDGTSVAVYFKAANDPKLFDQQQSCGPFYTQPVDLTACGFGPRRYLMAIVVLNTNDVNVQPRMSDLTVFYQQ